ncbi:MAG: caspase family protein [Planctomycetes bacterium]|nr:caspase family protein [Planctomycetota bacterium]
MFPKHQAVWCVAVASCLFASTPASAQQVTRLANDEPEIRFRADGRAGVCDVLAFTADGAALLAVGEDKVIHRWSVAPDKLRPARPLYWNTFREQRGAIYALAFSADRENPLVAIAGNGKLNADVAIFNLRSGELLGAVSALADNPGEYVRAGGVVWSLAFHPTGKELAIGDTFGNVWVSPLIDGKPVTAKTTRVVGGTAEATYGRRVVWVGYLPDGKLAYAKRDGGVYAVGKLEPLFRWGGEVEYVVGSADGRRLAAQQAKANAGEGSVVKVRTLPDGTGERIVHFPNTHYPARIALDATGNRVAVGLLEAKPNERGEPLLKPFVVELPGEVKIYDLHAETPKLVASLPVDHRPDAMAFHPDGKRFATADSLDHGTTLWAIENNTLRKLDRDVNAGRSLWAVGMTADGKHLCFKDKRNPDPQDPNERADPKAPWITFDLDTEPRGWGVAQTPVPPVKTLGGWSVAFIGKDQIRNEYQWYAVYEGQHFALPMNALQDDRPRCFTFLPAGEGAKPGTVRLAVGHAWGASVFDLVPVSGVKRIRRLNGHAGNVTAIAPAFGGKGLVTCGRDQTIAIWNLADFASEPLLGASFAVDGNKVVVKAVDLGSPAQEAGLSVGDEVLSYHRGDSTTAVPKERWLTEFRNIEPMREMLWSVKPINSAPGDTKQYGSKTSLLHRPAARFLPLANNEWVLYSYRQCYYDCSANGDSYIEWLVSKDRANKRPDVFGVEQFRKFLNKPEKLTDVITKLIREPAKPLLPDLFPPTVTLKTDLQKVAAGQDVKVTVTVVPGARQDGKVNAVTRVELWLNGHHRVGLDTLQGKKFEVGVPFDVTFTVQNKSLMSGDNKLNAVGVGFDDPGNGSGSGVSAPVRFVAAVDRPTRRLFVIAAGIRFYEKATDALGRDMDLPGASRDAARMMQIWSQVQQFGGYATEGAPKAVLLLNENVTKERLLKEIKQVGEIARPDDVLVLCLAGHGAMFSAEAKAAEGTPKDWYYIIPRTDEKSVLSAADYRNPDKFRNAFIRDSELAEVLVNLDCQPLVFLDCCHSGAASAKVGERALTRNSTRGFSQNGFGPVVVAACAPHQLSWETGDTVQTRGGLFSRSVALTLGEQFSEADKNKDGALSVQEFFLAVQVGTEKGASAIVDDLGKPVQQTPQISPLPDRLSDLVLSKQAVVKPKK